MSLFETVYHGVPVIAMPVFCDHDSNVEKAVQDNYAIRLELQELTSTKLLKSILTIINDTKYVPKIKMSSKIRVLILKMIYNFICMFSRYKNNALKRSLLLKDQLESPITRAIFWTEYVIKHNGGHHLQSPAKDMTFIRYYLIDIILLTISLIYLILYTSYLILKFSGKILSCKYYVKLKIS